MKLDKQTKSLLIVLCGAVLFHYLLTRIEVLPRIISATVNLFLPFIIGGGIAFVINAPMKKIEHLIREQHLIPVKYARIVSLLLSFIFVLGILIIVVFMVAPAFASAIVDVARSLPKWIQSIAGQLAQWFDNSPELKQITQQIEVSSENLLNGIVSKITGSIEGLANSIFGVFTQTIGTVFDLLIGIVFALYILLSKERLKRQLYKILFAVLPEDKALLVTDFGTLTNHSFSNFMTGQVAEAFINAALFFTVGLIFRFPYGVVIAVCMGFCALIPYFGAFMGVGIGFVLIASQSFPQAILFVLVAIVVQQIDGNIIYPKVVGDQIGLPAIWVLVAVTIGGNLYGIVGMILFVPIASVLYSIFQLTINRRLSNIKIDVDSIEARQLGKLFPSKNDQQDTL